MYSYEKKRNWYQKIEKYQVIKNIKAPFSKYLYYSHHDHWENK